MPRFARRPRDERLVITVIAAALLVIVASAATALHAIHQARDARAWVDHTNRVLTTVADVRDHAVEASAAVRGFILTRDQRFTTAFAAVPDRMARSFRDLGDLTADMPPQQDRIARLRPLLTERLALCARQLADASSGDAAAATAMIVQATDLDARIAAVLDEMRATEESLLAHRDAAARASTRRTVLFLALASAVAVLLGLGATPLVVHQIRARVRAEAALRASHADLERQITARTRDLAESRERLALAQAVAGIGTWDWRMDTDRLIWSPEIEAMFGLPTGAFGGRFADFVPFVVAEDLADLQEALRVVLAAGGRLDAEFRIRRRDGEVRWLHAIGRVVSPQRFIGIDIDVTEAKRATETIVASERRYRFLAESMPQIVWTATPDGRLDYINQVLADYIGRSVEAALGTSWTEIVHPDDLEETTRRWMRSVATGEDYAVEHRVLRHDGAWRWFLIRARCLRGADGAIQQWFGTSTDIHDQKERAVELERVVAERTGELRRANRELDSFSYSVSHDLRTPLRAIAGFADALEEDYGARLDAPALAHLARIRAAAKRMGEIIDALLGLSHLGRSRVALARVDVAAIARSILEDLARQDPPRAVRWRVEPCIAYGDAALVRTALENLLGNAWKFTRHTAEPRIDVTAADAPAGMIAIRVADNGAGFDQAIASKLFHAFKRFHDPARFPGSGIGLATVRRIVERHGGSIAAEGRPDGGAAFTFTLPASAPSAPRDVERELAEER